MNRRKFGNNRGEDSSILQYLSVENNARKQTLVLPNDRYYKYSS